jgi:hypothetical protein
MTEHHVHIRQRYREEFEQIGETDLRKRLERGLFDEEKRKHGWAWLDEKAHGEERAYRARQLALQERNDQRSNISLVVSVIAVIIAGLALYRSWPQSIPTPPTITQKP